MKKVGKQNIFFYNLFFYKNRTSACVRHGRFRYEWLDVEVLGLIFRLIFSIISSLYLENFDDLSSLWSFEYL